MTDPAKTGQEIMRDVRKETIEALDSLDARTKAIRVLVEEIEALETKFFQHEGVVTDERTVVSHSSRLKAIELLAQIYGLKSPDRMEHTGNLGVDLSERLENALNRGKASKSSDK